MFILIYDYFFPSDMIYQIKNICIVSFLGLEYVSDVKFECLKNIRKTIAFLVIIVDRISGLLLKN